MTSDRKDIRNEDYSSFISLNYVANFEKEVSWRVGLFQQSFLGKISPIIPMAEIAARGDDLEVAVGAIHLPELPDVAVVPFFRVTQLTKLDIDLKVVLPLSLSLVVALGERWTLHLDIERQIRFYRLTREEPWDRAVINFIQVRSTFEVGYHLFDAFLLKMGIGTVGDRQYRILDHDLDKISDFTLDEQQFWSGHIGLAVIPPK